MIAFAGTYPSFLESISRLGPLMQALLLLLVVAFAFGIYRLWRKPELPVGSVLLIGAPTLLGCALAACQSLAAESIVAANQIGMVSWSRPDRYIGHLRIYLVIGISMSVVLICIAYLRRHRSNLNGRSA